MGLAVAVSGVEAIGAVLIFALIGLLTAPRDPVALPILGDIGGLISSREPREMLLLTAVIVGIFFLIRACVVVSMAYVQARVTQSAGARLASRLHAGYMSMPYALSLMTNSAEQVRNVQVTVPLIVADGFTQGARAVSELIVVVILGLVLTISSPLAMALLLLVVVPVVLVLNLLVRPRLVSLGREDQDLAEGSVKVLQETLHGLREVRVYRRARHFIAKFATIRDQWARNKARRTVLRSIPATILETSLVLFITAFLMITASSETPIAEALPILGMFAYVGFRLKPSLTQVVDGANSIRAASAAIADLYDDLRRAEEWTEQDEEGEGSFSFEESIEVQDVRFSYPGASTPSLEGINLVIAKGSFVGFVGPTGGGKSTLIDILIGLLEPDAGMVLVDGVNIATAPTAWLERLGVVPQNVFLLDESIRENVALGIPDTDIDEQRLSQSLQLAQLKNFVEGLPERERTRLGERGVRLSGGQRQRIGLARALYGEPDVLILDEGTAALDNRTEADVIGALEQLHGSATLLMVAHRLTTVRRCDVIHVVVDGRIVSSGTYEELETSSEHFKQLTRGT